MRSLLISSSNVHGYGYLDQPEPFIREFLGDRKVYLDPDPSSTHKGKTREERLREFHEENATPLVGLREGSCLRVDDDRATLVGDRQARIFRRGETPFEVDPGTRMDQVVR